MVWFEQDLTCAPYPSEQQHPTAWITAPRYRCPSPFNNLENQFQVCFDKTGTLTEDGLDMWGVVGTSKDQIDGLGSTDSTSTEFLEAETQVERLSDLDPLKTCLAACHSLTTIDQQLVNLNLFIVSRIWLGRRSRLLWQKKVKTWGVPFTITLTLLQKFHVMMSSLPCTALLA